jgi:two-component system invasion response regulator UvrY
MIRLVIADDHPLIRAGFRQLASHDGSIAVVGEAAEGNTLLDVLRSTAADVVTLDINMPGPGYQELIAQIRASRPALQILVVSMYPERELALRALQAGAAGYVTKTHAESELLAAVRKVARGGKYVTPSLAEWLAERLGKGLDETEELSDRERDVLRLLSEGKSYKEIAATLSISAKTISTYRARLVRKLGVRTTAELIRYALQQESSRIV